MKPLYFQTVTKGFLLANQNHRNIHYALMKCFLWAFSLVQCYQFANLHIYSSKFVFIMLIQKNVIHVTLWILLLQTCLDKTCFGSLFTWRFIFSSYNEWCIMLWAQKGLKCPHFKRWQSRLGYPLWYPWLQFLLVFHFRRRITVTVSFQRKYMHRHALRGSVFSFILFSCFLVHVGDVPNTTFCLCTVHCAVCIFVSLVMVDFCTDVVLLRTTDYYRLIRLLGLLYKVTSVCVCVFQNRWQSQSLVCDLHFLLSQ